MNENEKVIINEYEKVKIEIRAQLFAAMADLPESVEFYAQKTGVSRNTLIRFIEGVLPVKISTVMKIKNYLINL